MEGRTANLHQLRMVLLSADGYPFALRGISALSCNPESNPLMQSWHDSAVTSVTLKTSRRVSADVPIHTFQLLAKNDGSHANDTPNRLRGWLPTS
jgi:hypothetical protein